MSGRPLAWLFVLGLFTGFSLPAPAAIYEVPENSGNLVGAWDANIMADDVHFASAAILSKVRIRLAIAGVQTCRLWLFDALASPPIYTAAFTNVPAGVETAVSTYDFDMEVLVPKDIYVGFSAQGGGWGGNAVDYWSSGVNIVEGSAGTAGQYYYGSVAGGQLTTAYNSGDASFGCLQILSAPVNIDAVSVATGHVHMAISSLPLQITSIVERSSSAMGTNWQEVAVLPLGASNQTWIATNPVATSFFYRVKNR